MDRLTEIDLLIKKLGKEKRALESRERVKDYGLLVIDERSKGELKLKCGVGNPIFHTVRPHWKDERFTTDYDLIGLVKELKKECEQIIKEFEDVKNG